MLINRVKYRKMNYLIVGEQSQDEVHQFKYLRALVTSAGDQTRYIEARAAAEIRCSSALKGVWRSKVVSRMAKLRVYKTVIKFVA